MHENYLNRGIQQTGDYTDVFKILLNNINVVRLGNKPQIKSEYVKAVIR